jgi:hypothetical protein
MRRGGGGEKVEGSILGSRRSEFYLQFFIDINNDKTS